ncbi:heterokaryon incompatibility protein-domain-containing protein [Scleroderma yunnanense]
MRLINVEAFTGREESIRKGRPVNRRTKVLEFCDDEATVYAILSHRWTNEEVDYDEMVELAKMEVEERAEIRGRHGYRKILASCEQAKRDGYKWLWVDTCCIDKRSSAELSEAINSMYRWYDHSSVCYAYLHDVVNSSTLGRRDTTRYPDTNGWPEWFSRGWTLQEMIAPSHVQFFNRNWQRIGDKKTLARTLSRITGVPEHILKHGLSSNRPCIAQIMSWAADRTTTRVEDRAYSLLGLLEVNMPMLYGEGKKAFHRLQLEIMRVSNDQSIFAWGTGHLGQERIGNILADDPSFFADCGNMELIDHNEFIEYHKNRITGGRSIDEEHFGVFPVTNRGIQIWMFLDPLESSDSVFQAWLPCRHGPSLSPVSITLALWNSSYYRYRMSLYSLRRTLQFRQVYLRYQDMPHSDLIFEIDDSAVIQNGFTYYGMFPKEVEGNAHTLTSTDPLCVKVYFHTETQTFFVMGFGQCFGQHWIHPVYYEKPAGVYSWRNHSRSEYDKMLVRGPSHARSMAEVCSRGARYGRLWVKHTLLPGSTWTVQTSCTVWESSGNCGVRIDAFRYPYNEPDNCRGFDVVGTNDPICDIRGLMITHSPGNEFRRYTLLVDGAAMEWSLAPKGIKLGDYGCFTVSEDFRCEGNIFSDPESLAMMLNIFPKQHKIDADSKQSTDSNYVEVRRFPDTLRLYKPLGLSLPSNHDVISLLISLSTRLTNKYLVVSLIQCTTMTVSGGPSFTSTIDPTTPLCIFRKPFIWHRGEDAGSASGQRQPRLHRG